MTCKLCPLRRHCFDKGSCETCDFGKAFEGYNKKLKRLKAKSETLEAENEALRQRLAETETEAIKRFAERLKNRACWFCENQAGYDHFNEACDDLVKEMTGEQI